MNLLDVQRGTVTFIGSKMEAAVFRFSDDDPGHVELLEHVLKVSYTDRCYYYPLVNVKEIILS